MSHAQYDLFHDGQETERPAQIEDDGSVGPGSPPATEGVCQAEQSADGLGIALDNYPCARVRRLLARVRSQKFRRTNRHDRRAASLQEIKFLIRLRDGFRCVDCGMTYAQHLRRHRGRNLDVHRKSPGGPYTTWNCETLCRRCHGPKVRSKRGSGTKLSITCPGRLRSAIRLRAANENISARRLLLDLLTEEFSEELEKLGNFICKPKRSAD